MDVLDDSEELEELAEGEIPMTEEDQMRAAMEVIDRAEMTRRLKSTVWIIERNHHPLIEEGKVVSFPDTTDGAQAVRDYLNTFPAILSARLRELLRCGALREPGRSNNCKTQAPQALHQADPATRYATPRGADRG